MRDRWLIHLQVISGTWITGRSRDDELRGRCMAANTCSIRGQRLAGVLIFKIQRYGLQDHITKKSLVNGYRTVPCAGMQDACPGSWHTQFGGGGGAFNLRIFLAIRD